MLIKVNIGMRTRYKVHMIILSKKCNWFSMSAEINFPVYLSQIDKYRQHVFMTF